MAIPACSLSNSQIEARETCARESPLGVLNFS
jgi:hypothetical protein